jgi:hypothetical protein
MRSHEQIIDKLARSELMPAEELRTLSDVQLTTIWQVFEDKRRNRINPEEAAKRLMEIGFFDLPTVRKKLNRSILDLAVDEINSIVDYHNAQCLQRGETDELINLVKDDDEPYPRARSN